MMHMSRCTCRSRHAKGVQHCMVMHAKLGLGKPRAFSQCILVHHARQLNGILVHHAYTQEAKVPGISRGDGQFLEPKLHGGISPMIV